MKIGIVSYPGLWQRHGGLQVQIERTAAALRCLGVELKIVDLVNEKLGSYDLIHAFSAGHGMHVTLEEAKSQGVKVVLSPVLQPEPNLQKFYLYRFINWLAFQFSSNEIKTSYGQIRNSLKNADMIFSLSALETGVITQGYKIPKEKTMVIPNGIDDHFFETHTVPLPSALANLQGYVFVAGSISDYKNQLGVIEATDRPVVLAGPAKSPGYLEKCMRAGGSRVHYAGMLDSKDPLLASLYAHAAVNVLASYREAGPLCSVESLACGTPAVVTEKNGLPLKAQAPLLQFVNSNDKGALKHAIEVAAQASPAERAACRELVADLRWSTVAKSILPVYQNLVEPKNADSNLFQQNLHNKLNTI